MLSETECTEVTLESVRRKLHGHFRKSMVRLGPESQTCHVDIPTVSPLRHRSESSIWKKFSVLVRQQWGYVDFCRCLEAIQLSNLKLWFVHLQSQRPGKEDLVDSASYICLCYLGFWDAKGIGVLLLCPSKLLARQVSGKKFRCFAAESQSWITLCSRSLG